MLIEWEELEKAFLDCWMKEKPSFRDLVNLSKVYGLLITICFIVLG